MAQISLLNLGEDIIEAEIIPLLSQRDIKSLKLTSKEIFALVEQSPFAWKQLYKDTFGSNPTPYSSKRWPELYDLRKRAKLYAWGSLSGGRLAISAREVSSHALSRRSGISSPTKVPDIDAVLADVTAGGFSFQILTDSGDIYSTAVYHGHDFTGPGPSTNDFNELELLAREQETQQLSRYLRDSFIRYPQNTGVGGDLPTPIPRTIPGQAYSIQVDSDEQDSIYNKKHGIKNRYLRREKVLNAKDNVKFISISSGRSHFVGLSDSGKIWSWDRGDYGVQIGLLDSSHQDLESKGHRALKVVAGWDSTVAYFHNYGLVYWKKRNALKQGESKAYATSTRVPNTEKINGPDRVVDFVTGASFLIYLTEAGQVFRYDMGEYEPFLLADFQNYLKSHSNSTSPKFVRLSGSFLHYAAFSNEGTILIGSKDSNIPVVYEDLQNKDCISVAMGDHHFLALLKDGTLLSWGRQLGNCGCLGLGSMERTMINQVVEKPTVVPIESNKKVLAIAAGGWHSGAIISEI